MGTLEDAVISTLALGAGGFIGYMWFRHQIVGFVLSSGVFMGALASLQTPAEWEAEGNLLAAIFISAVVGGVIVYVAATLMDA